MAQATQTDTTPTIDDRASFDDRMCELTTGMDLLIDRLNHALDLGSNLGADYGKDGWYVMNAINETQWITQRLSADLAKVRNHFNQDPSTGGKVKFAQAAE